MREQSAKILIVDDDARLRELLIDTLNTIGYNADIASDGNNALQKLQHNHYDLVISDIRMPELDGFMLLKKIRQHYPELPVLFITGVTSEDMIGSANPDGFLAKPFRIGHIEQLIKDALSKKHSKNKHTFRRVMIVEDDDLFRDMLGEALQYNSFITTAVEGGKEALRELQYGKVDAVITDIKMPGMDGITLLKEIKKIKPDLPVILISAFFSDEDILKSSSDYQPAGFLQKPFEIQAIVKLLDSLPTVKQ